MSGLRPRKPLCAFVDLGSDWMFGIESGVGAMNKRRVDNGGFGIGHVVMGVLIIVGPIKT